MTTARPNLSVTIPFGEALTRVGAVLFQPFDIAKWFIIGFCAWLAYLGEGAGFGGGNFGGGHGHGGQSMRGELNHARDFVMNNLAWILPLAIGLFLVIMAIWLVILWVSSRGRFMFLHCVALNTAEIREPWQRFAAEANSLFVFRLLIGIGSLVVFLPLAGGLALVVMRMILREAASPGGVLASLGLMAAMALAGGVFWTIGRLTRDFVVPIQFMRRSRCLDAWRELWGLASGNVGNLALYLLFRILLGIGISVLVIIVVVATCCIAGCLLLLPYLGTVLLLPILVFERSYSLKYLAQFGPEYDVFSPPSAPVSSGQAI